jgi:hypothetical protein
MQPGEIELSLSDPAYQVASKFYFVKRRRWAGVSALTIQGNLIMTTQLPDAIADCMNTIQQDWYDPTEDTGGWRYFKEHIVLAGLTARDPQAVIAAVSASLGQPNGVDTGMWNTRIQNYKDFLSHWSSVTNFDPPTVASLQIAFLECLLNGYNHAAHNEDLWQHVNDAASAGIAQVMPEKRASEVMFSGPDTRRVIPDPSLLPEAMSSSFLMKKNGLPAHYVDIFNPLNFRNEPRAHLEYLMRLNADPGGAAYFLLTHSQDRGGYIAIAKIDARCVEDHRIVCVENDRFAGKVVWWDHLDSNHPSGGMNHPGNGGQVGSVVVIVGQDWTKTYPVYGHAVDPVGNGSKVLFYDFDNPGKLEGTTGPGPYIGCMTTQQLGLRPGEDGEVKSVNIEQGPDGMYYLIAANPAQTVIWKSSKLHPDAEWTQVGFLGDISLDDGSSQLAWSKLGTDTKALYFVKAEGNGMAFHELQYQTNGNDVLSVHVEKNPAIVTKQDGRFDGWVSEDGSIYVSPTGAIALYGAYVNIDDSKTTDDGESDHAIQVRAWYGPATG